MGRTVLSPQDCRGLPKNRSWAMLVPGEVWEPGPCQLLEFPSTGERTIFLQHKSGFPFDLCRSLGTNTFPATLLSPSLELA